jgi:hypothetical protein
MTHGKQPLGARRVAVAGRYGILLDTLAIGAARQRPLQQREEGFAYLL